jgi:hypothetical protein
MVNKYRKEGGLTIDGSDSWVYNSITDMYHAGETAITKTFIDNYNRCSRPGKGFEAVEEIEVKITGDREKQNLTIFSVDVKFPKNMVISESYLQELIYNALNSQK